MARPVGWAIILVLAFAAEARALSEKANSEWEQMYRRGGAFGRIVLQVKDDKGFPVEGANVEAYFNANPRGVSVRARTSGDGSIEVEGKSNYDVRFTVDKEGYYTTSVPYYFHEHATSQEDAIQSGRWMPLNQSLAVTLKKVRNPVPMYARSIYGLTIPCDQPVGFDLEIGDLVAPNGKGAVPDLVFRVDRRMARGNAPLRWICSFSNKMDGMQQLSFDTWSRYPTIHEAPSDGYIQPFEPPEYPIFRQSKASEVPPSYYQIFRVRSHSDSAGRIAGAKYGKIEGIGAHDGGQTAVCKIGFAYWYNPDGTRNLEFNTRRNLGVKRRSGDELLDKP